MELSHSSYTVGWVCALPKEQTAATAMLDQRHKDLQTPSADSNSYTLGSIGDHNIVIACLPKGKYGNNSASAVWTRMTGTFPSIKIGLMVGIGGGVPPKVRRGDVVISAPSSANAYPGVVQWDIGKAEDGGNLLTALTKMEYQHEMEGSGINDHLGDLARKYPGLKSKYTWSDSLKDPLDPRRFQPKWKALILAVWEIVLALFAFLVGWPVLTTTNNGTERLTGMVDPESNGTQIKSVKVHYGLIASGNQVIKDAKVRDAINKDLGGDVLCFEMEAAGLMNDFSCIVIRGICDYADSQKNKDWQEYAAAVAAACAKELLQYVQPSDVLEERPVKDILSES
ncbi:Nucleoside phosphorylase [Penicillium italicum]|uniref:Nucleoside phosphorylase n=1 Tax=Penicillium italicum TaxID=40296 RepID=A0A0A2KBH1_PENIT|nr:Nucleoside phosphorylase [Penicillium italicum]